MLITIDAIRKQTKTIAIDLRQHENRIRPSPINTVALGLGKGEQAAKHIAAIEP